MTNFPLNASVEEILASGQVKPDSVGSKRLGIADQCQMCGAVPPDPHEMGCPVPPSDLLRADYAEYLRIKEVGRFVMSENDPGDHFAITEPGQYRTRSGQVATIVMTFPRNAIGYVEDDGKGNHHGWIWWLSGRAHRDNASHDYDIVGEA